MDNTRSIILLSFGYKSGRPPKDIKTFDVRHVEGPNKNMRCLTGESAILRKELFMNDEFREIYEYIKNDILNDAENNRFAIGCEMGKHRSVAMVEELKRELQCKVSIIHTGLGIGEKGKSNKIRSERDKKYQDTIDD